MPIAGLEPAPAYYGLLRCRSTPQTTINLRRSDFRDRFAVELSCEWPFAHRCGFGFEAPNEMRVGVSSFSSDLALPAERGFK